MNKIKVMDSILSNKIAAGEVVEGCFSVVKELVENSIDAKSNKIKIELIESGTSLIKVVDNGVGMNSEDAKNCFLRHATSKLYDENDLFRISTLGFRGEALASIASVSLLEMHTSYDDSGTVIELNGGNIINCSKGNSRKGTIIKVKNLFYNTPARLKHMGSLYKELADITNYVNKIALSHPEISFELINDSRVILNTDGSGNLLKVINSIYGVKVSKRMINIDGFNDDYKINGFISFPEVTRSNRNHINIMVNGRVVKNYEINRIINDCYHTYKPDNRFPIVCLNIFVDSSLIDVNIHPTKMDIKFSKMEELKDLLSSLIKEKLCNLNLIPKIEESVSLTSNYVNDSIDFNYEIDDSNYDYNSDFFNKKEDNIDITIKENVKIEKEDESFEKSSRVPMMYPVGSVFGTFIVYQNDDSMFLIDQHAAKERINYEMCLKKLTSYNREMIASLFPLVLEYPVNEFIILKENFDFIKSLGFEIEEFGINSIIVKSHPTFLTEGYEEDEIKKIFEMVVMREDKFDMEKFIHKVAATVSCKMSIKANSNVTMLEMEQLVKDLMKCENPFTCPHGRPTIITYTRYELEKLFKRVI